MKMTFSFLMILIFPVILHAQSRGWEVDLGIAGTLSDVTLLRVTGDSLTMEVSDRTKAIELSWVNKLERRDDPSRIPKFIVGGTIIGGLSGFVFGSLIDHGPEGKDENKKFTYGAIGGLLGGSLGTIIALSFGKTTHDLNRMTVDQKCTLLDSIITYDGATHSPLIDSSVIQESRNPSVAALQQDSGKPVERVFLSVGPSIPLGDFGKNVGGSAKTGAAITVELALGQIISRNQMISWTVGGTVSFNPVNDASPMYPPNTKVSYGSWWTVWPMTGLKIHDRIFPNITAYIHGQIGFLIGFPPEVVVSSPNGNGKIPSDMKASLGGSIGGGFIIKDKYQVDARYIGGVSMESTATQPSGGISARIAQPTSILLLTFGIGL